MSSHDTLSGLPVELTLDDGTEIRIRRVRPDDRELIRKGLRHFSQRSTYMRFFTPVVRFSEEHLDYLTDVDGVDHLALGALDVTGGEEQGVGVARYIRLRQEPHVAEAAVAVLDAYQGRGIGSLLLAALSRCAAAHGIEIFRAYLLEENRRFLRFLQAIGAIRQQKEGDIVQVDLPVYRELSQLPEGPETRTARGAWKQLDAALAAS